MILVGTIIGNGVHILIDTGGTHNIIDNNSDHPIGLAERRITTTVLIGSGIELACQGACFAVPLRIDSKTFQIDAFLLPISDDIDVILGAPWLTDISNAILAGQQDGNLHRHLVPSSVARCGLTSTNDNTNTSNNPVGIDHGIDFACTTGGANCLGRLDGANRTSHMGG